MMDTDRIIKTSYLYTLEEYGVLVSINEYKRRRCVLKGSTFCVYKEDKEDAPLRLIHAEDVDQPKPFTPVSEREREKGFYFEVSTKNGGKTHCFRAETQSEREGWLKALEDFRMKQTMSRKKSGKTSNDFVTIECFIKAGIRVTGVVETDILNILSGATTKKMDERGWFCECYLAACDVINLMIEYGWTLETAHASVGQHISGELRPLHLLAFKKRQVLAA